MFLSVFICNFILLHNLNTFNKKISRCKENYIVKFIDSKEKLKEFLNYEANKYGLKKCKYPFFSIKEKEVLFKCNYLLRKTEYYTNKNSIWKYLYKYALNKYKCKYAMSIPLNVFDKGLYFVHIGPRLVNGNSKIGKDCVMHINTCIVAGGSNDYAPQIGDNVVLGVGSVISGMAIIGDNVAVGANSFVNKDFSDGNMTIAGVPAKKISSNTPNDWNKK